MVLKLKYLVVLQEPFSLDIPYTDRQRVVIVADAERRSRACREVETVEPQGDGGPVTSEVADEFPGAVIGRHLHRGLEGLQYAGAGIVQALEDRAARSAPRRRLGALIIGRTRLPAPIPGQKGTSVPGGRHGFAERAHAISLGASAGIVVVVSSSRKPPDWCCHSRA
jgi:hypothetical protein